MLVEDFIEKFSEEINSERKFDLSEEFVVKSLNVVYSLRHLDENIFELFSFESNEPKKGNGSKFMKQLINFADNYDIELVVFASPYGDMLLEKLKHFYEKFGFLFAFENSEGIRLPKTI